MRGHQKFYHWSIAASHWLILFCCVIISQTLLLCSVNPHFTPPPLLGRLWCLMLLGHLECLQQLRKSHSNCCRLTKIAIEYLLICQRDLHNRLSAIAGDQFYISIRVIRTDRHCKPQSSFALKRKLFLLHVMSNVYCIKLCMKHVYQ